MIRALAKRLPHPLLMRIHHHYQLARQSALAREASSRTGLPLLETLDLRPLKTSETVFVLGSGSSINEISDARWSVIGRHDSIAMNFWLVHPFVPRIYLFENIERVDDYEVMFDVLQRYLNRRAGDYCNVVKVVSEVRPAGTRQLVFEIPERFRPNLYIGHSAYLAARNERELITGIRFLQRQGIFAPGSHLAWHFKNGGSVTAAISLAARMNYRRIVLCGVDLGRAQYFYQHPERYPDACGWEFIPRTQPHIAARRFQWGLPAPEVIYHFKQQVLDPAGIELFVENRSSTLFPLIPQVTASMFDSLAYDSPRAPGKVSG